VASISSRRLLRPVGFDELGLRRAISDRMLPFLVAAMAPRRWRGIGSRVRPRR
jgi:hypothetical protein